MIVKLGEDEMRFNKITVGSCVALILTFGLAVGSLHVSSFAQSPQIAETVSVAVGPQYDTTHVYVAPEDFDRFIASLIATFGGTTTKQGVFTVTPTQSSTMSQLVLTPVGTVSVFGFKTPIPYPFGFERTGYLVTNIDEAVRAAKASGADVFVAPFNDPIGRDAIIQWPGGVNTQLYWHTTAPSYTSLQTVPENRVYVSPDRVDAFVRSFLVFSHGTVLSDDARAPGVEIGKPAETYRRVRIESKFGKLTALVTDGHLPYPYGREMMGYHVTNLAETLARAKAAGADVLVPPYKTDERDAVVVRFPGGYIAEIHSVTKK
jgi:predicted enzyme related to lactoylglutathione lyase